MKNNRVFRFLTSVKWAGFLLLFFAGLFFWFPASAEELTKEEQLQFVRTILREASAEIPNLPDDNFPPYGKGFVQYEKAELLKDVAILQGKAYDQEGLKLTVASSIQITDTSFSSVMSLIRIGGIQVNAGFIDDGVHAILAALEVVGRQDVTKGSLDRWLQPISETLAKAGRTDRAINVAGMISGETERFYALEAIRFHEAKAGREKMAQELYGLSQKAFAKLEEVEGKKKAWVLVRKASNHFALNEVESAENTLSQVKIVIKGIQEGDVRVYLLIEIAKEERKMGEEILYEQTLQEAINIIPGIKDGYDSGMGNLAVAEYLLEHGEEKRAWPFLAKASEKANLVNNKYLKGHTLLMVAKSEIKVGQIEKAKRLLHEALDVVEESEKLVDKLLLIQEFHWFKNGMEKLLFEGIERIQRIVQDIAARKEPAKSYALDVLANLYAQNGLLEKSFETIGQMGSDQPVKGKAIQRLAKFKTKKNGVPLTVKWAKSLDVTVEKVRAHIGIAEGVLGALDAQEP